MRQIGILTTDAALVVRSWDGVLERMTGVPASAACGRPLRELAPEADARGVIPLLADTLLSGAVTVLAPAIHHFLIACAPAHPSDEFDVMQQRVIATPLTNDAAVVGLAISIEDVTERLDAERRLARALRDPDPAVRRAALDQFGTRDGSGPDPFRAAIGHDDWQLRRAAVHSIAAQPDPDLLHAIVAALRDGHHDFSLLSSALRLLSLTGMDAAAALVELLHSEEPDLRIQAALALSLQSGPVVVSALLRALDDDDRNVRFQAVESLGKLRARDAVEPLGLIAASNDFFLAFPAIEALVAIGDARAVPSIVPRLADRALREAAADALGAIGDEEAVAPLVARLHGPEAPIGPVVAALSRIHSRYEEMSGAGGRIEDLTRRLLAPEGAAAILDFVRVAGGPELRAALMVLSWCRTPAIAADLTLLLGQAAVPHDVIETLVRFGSPILDALIAQLARGDIDTRRAAAVALGRVGDRDAVPALIDALGQGEPELMVPVARALARLGDDRAFKPLIACLGHPDPRVRQAAVGALNSIGHSEMSSEIAVLLGDAEPHVRESAAKIAGYFGYPNCAGALIVASTDADERVRAAALEHLAFLDDPGVLPAILSAVRHDTPRCRAAAASALGHLPDRAAGDALRDALADDDDWVRYFAALSLGRRREPDAADALVPLAQADRAGHVRMTAIEALGAIGGDRALAALEPLTESADADIAAAALRAIGGIDVPRVSAILMTALRSQDSGRRVAATQGLATCGGSAAVEALRWTASADQDQTVVSAALSGLASLASRPPEATAGAVEALVAVAANPDRRPQALQVLARIPADAVPSLGGVLHHPDVAIRVAGVEALGRIARPPASSLLMEALGDPEPSVRVSAVEALSRLGAQRAAGRFARLAYTDDSPDVRRAAEAALGRAGGADAHDEP
jgi:HEAT repeat protein